MEGIVNTIYVALAIFIYLAVWVLLWKLEEDERFAIGCIWFTFGGLIAPTIAYILLFALTVILKIIIFWLSINFGWISRI